MIKNIIISFLTLVIAVMIIVIFTNDNDRSEEVYPNIIHEKNEDNSKLYHANSYNQSDFKYNADDSELYSDYLWSLNADKLFYSQLFFGKWKVIDIVPVEVNIPSVYSGFDENNVLKGQDLIDNIVGQEILFGIDYIENQNIRYKINGDYKSYSVPLMSENTIIGCSSAKTLGITGDYVTIVFYEISHEDKSERVACDFVFINQLYLKDINTIYASIDGYLTFELQRVYLP